MPAGAAVRGRVPHLRREIQLAFGASLLGVVTASCVAEQRSVPAATPSDPIAAHELVESTPHAAESDAGGAAGASGDAEPSGAVVAIYGSSAVAIHSTIEYSHDSLFIDAAGERTLAALTELLDAFDCDIEIQGHAGRDEAKAAAWLSRRRAELVRERLLTLGADPERLTIRAFGASQPRARSSDALARDRRVSFAFYAVQDGVRRACDGANRREQ